MQPYGEVDQLEDRCLRKAEAGGSNPPFSTRYAHGERRFHALRENFRFSTPFGHGERRFCFRRGLWILKVEWESRQNGSFGRVYHRQRACLRGFALRKECKQWVTRGFCSREYDFFMFIFSHVPICLGKCLVWRKTKINVYASDVIQ